MKQITRRIAAAEGAPGAENIGINAYFDDALGEDVTDDDPSGHPLHLVKIATQVSNAAATDYPVDGTGLLVAVNNAGPAVVRLAANIPQSQEGVGLLLLLTGGPALGRWRLITAYAAAQRDATLSRIFDGGAVPNVGDPYVLLVNTFRFKRLHLVAAIGEDPSAVAGLEARAILFDYPRTPAGGYRAARPYWDQKIALANEGSSDRTIEPNYYATPTRVVTCEGALGAKWRVYSTATVSLCSGAA